MGVGLARTPFDLAQTYSGASQAAIEKFLQQHPGYEQLVKDDPTGQALEGLGAIGAWAGITSTAEAAAKAAAAIGRPLGIDAEKQTWSWENFKDAWVNHPVESFAAVFPLGAAFLKRKGITPSETQVRELVDSAVRDEKTPLAQELKNELEEGPPHEAPVAQKGEAESGAAEQPAETSSSAQETGPQETKNLADGSPETDKVGKEPVEPEQPQRGEKSSEGSPASEGKDFRQAEEAATLESTPWLYKRLVRNIIAAGEPRPPGHVAHHVVSLDDRRAGPARDILKEFDIPINSADNGVWLPGAKDAGRGPYHPGLNTKKYHEEVYRRLEQATSREEILEVLRKLKKGLSENKFPY